MATAMKQSQVRQANDREPLSGAPGANQPPVYAAWPASSGGEADLSASSPAKKIISMVP